jgi:hypothetical protein
LTLHLTVEAGAPSAGPALHAAPKRRPILVDIGGPYSWLTPYIATMAGANESIAARILSLPRDELHFIAMTLAFMRDAENPARIEDLARAIGRDRREAILRAFAREADPKLARYCARLAGKPWRAASYRRLAELVAEPHARKLLRHMKAISRRDVLMLTRLPPAFRTRGVLKMSRDRRDFRRIVFAIEIVRRVRTDLFDRQILASLERADSTDIKQWVEAHYERLPFPAAPSGVLIDARGAVLRPIACGAELRRAAIDYENCARTYVERAATGASVFYRCERGERRIALAELRPVPGLGWAICELMGPRNRELDGEDRSAIIAAFAAAGIAATPQAKSPFGWFPID